VIDLRFHLVSTTAIFLALAVGVVLGTTVLRDPVLSRLGEDTERAEAQAEQLREERAEVERRYEAAAGVAEAAAGGLLEDALEDRGVGVVEAPGADEAAAAALTSQVERAGGEVVGVLHLAERYVAEGEETFLRELTDQVAGEVELPEGGAHERAAALLAASTLGEPDDDEQISRAAALAAFAEADLLRPAGEAHQGADVLLLAEAAPSQGAGPDAQRTAALEGFSAAAEEAGYAAVVAGPHTSAHGEGLVSQARDTGGPSTVDVYGDAAGAVVTVFALAAADAGEVVHYGVGPGAEGLGVPKP
jgi:hypothetical protein